MAHYEERMNRDLEAIRAQVADLSARVDRAVDGATRALLRFDKDLAAEVALGDQPLNRQARDIDQLCHVFVARHLPAAGILRYVSSVLRLTIELERVGDYAVAIAREVGQLSQPAPDSVGHDLEMLAQHSQSVLSQALQAFAEGSADRARATKSVATEWSTTFDSIFRNLLQTAEEGSRPIKDAFGLFFVFIRLVRVSDQAKNICEETVYAVTGETKQRRDCRILFVDERNDFRSPMAEVIARKAFPEGCVYASAGWHPADEVAPEVLAYLDGRGHEVQQLRPRPVPTERSELAEYDAIVSLDGPSSTPVPDLPFHTVQLRWQIGPPSAPPPSELTTDVLEETRQQLSAKIQDLMQILLGDRAG